MNNRNVIAIIVWVLGIIGATTGYINQFGFFALILPLLFIIFGTSFTRSHAKEYFNVLLGSVVIYYLGIAVNWLLSPFNMTFDFKYIALVYFVIMAIAGLLKAMANKRFRAPLSFRLFK